MAHSPEPGTAVPLPRLETLSTEPPAGPTVMARTHENAMRKTVARLKAHLTDRDEAADLLRVAVLSYLGEWCEMYAAGAREAGMPTERVILQIRKDTVQQMVAELGKATAPEG